MKHKLARFMYKNDLCDRLLKFAFIPFFVKLSPHTLDFRLLPFIFYLLSFNVSSAQPTTDEQLAVHYFQNGEYDKAVLYYEKLYEKNPGDFFYGYYLKTLVQLEDYKTAEKVVRKQLKRYPDMVNYQVDLGYVYAKSGNASKAKQQFEQTIKKLTPNQSEVIQLANAFIAIGEATYALQTYQQGRKMLRGDYPFNIEIAEIYATAGNHEAMIAEYLSLLEANESYLQQVQNALQRSLSFELNTKQNQLLKSQLINYIQKYPNSSVFPDMLIWIYIQEKDFESAFVQAKALDKRFREDGSRMIALAQLALSNQEYDVAIKSYQYIIEKGKNNPYYTTCRMELLNTMNQKITLTGNYTMQDLSDLEKYYYAALEELGKDAGTVSLIKDLAFLQAYYLNKADIAIVLLNEAIVMPRIKPQLQAECKLALGDILVIKDEIWDAALFYAQVEKEYKFDQLGDEAKFRNAKVAYYTGDFKWAKAYLDVLKGSTSKLIANDALRLSLLITDNTTIDSLTTPLLIYSKAELLTLQNKDSIALLLLDSINITFPGHTLADDILYQKHKIALKRRDYEKAIAFLLQIADQYPSDILADDALFSIAHIFQFNLKNLDKAKEYYEKLIFDFPGSLYVVEARKRFRILRGDKVN